MTEYAKQAAAAGARRLTPEEEKERERQLAVLLEQNRERAEQKFADLEARYAELEAEEERKAAAAAAVQKAKKVSSDDRRKATLARLAEERAAVYRARRVAQKEAVALDEAKRRQAEEDEVRLVDREAELLRQQAALEAEAERERVRDALEREERLRQQAAEARANLLSSYTKVDDYWVRRKKPLAPKPNRPDAGGEDDDSSSSGHVIPPRQKPLAPAGLLRAKPSVLSLSMSSSSDNDADDASSDIVIAPAGDGQRKRPPGPVLSIPSSDDDESSDIVIVSERKSKPTGTIAPAAPSAPSQYGAEPVSRVPVVAPSSFTNDLAATLLEEIRVARAELATITQQHFANPMQEQMRVLRVEELTTAIPRKAQMLARLYSAS